MCRDKNDWWTAKEYTVDNEGYDGYWRWWSEEQYYDSFICGGKFKAQAGGFDLSGINGIKIDLCILE